MQGIGDGFRRGALLGLTLALLASASSAGAASRSFITTSFDTIRLIAPVRVMLTTGGGIKARGEGDSEMLDRIDLSVSGKSLTIRQRPAGSGQKAGPPPTLYLSTDELHRVVIEGGGSLQIDRMKGLRGEIVLMGSGDVTVDNVALDDLNLILAGGGRAKLAGNAGMFSAIVTGPGTLEADQLVAKQLKLTNDGPGSTRAAALTTAVLIARGSGNVTVTGKGACTVDRQGTGVIACGGKDY